MHRRAFLGVTVGAASALAGCLQGEAVLHETNLSATSPTTEWEVELEAGSRMRLEVEKTDDFPGDVTGYVHRAETGAEIARARHDGADETFEVPATGTYVVSVDVSNATGEIILRRLE